MKRKQITAILLSAVMTVSACIPMNGISAFAAETTGEGNTEIAAAVEAEEEAPAEEAGPESTEPAQEVQEESAAEPEEAAEPQEPEEPEAEEASQETAEETEDKEAVSESDAAEADTVSDNTEEEEKEEAAPAAPEADQEDAVQEDTVQEDAVQGSTDKQNDAEEIVEEEEPETVKGKEAKKAEVPTAEDFDNAVDMEVGGSYDVNVSEENPYVYFRITPDETANYRIYSQADDLDTYGTLYGADQSEIAYDDDAAGNGQFEIVQVLVAGRTYYLRARLYDITSSGNFTVWLEKNDADVDFFYEGQEYNDVYYLPGKEVTLSVFAYSTVGEITYSWTDSDGNTVAGNTDEYTFEPQEECTVYCTATYGAGDSFTWTFNIINDNNLQLNVEESNYKINYGNPVTLRAIVTAVDMSQLQYQWYRCEGEYEPGGDNQWVKIDGANQTEYTVEKVESAEVYQFSVTDQFGSGRSTDIRVSVENHFSAYIIEGPEGEEYKTEEAHVYVSPNETATLSVSVEADNKEGITYKWSKNGVEIAGASSADYKTEAVTAEASYYCVVSDRFGNSDQVMFYVTPNNQLYAYYLDEDGEKYSEHDVYASLNETATLSVGVDAIDKNGITYKWYDANYDTIEGAVGAEFTTEPVTESKIYYCGVSDSYGSYSEVKFTVGVDTHLEAYPEGYEGQSSCEVYANGAEFVTLRVVASADEGNDLEYEWHDSLDFYSETSAELTVRVLDDYQYFYCDVTDSYRNRKTVTFCVRTGQYENDLSAEDSEDWGSYCHRTVDLNGSKTLTVEVYANDTSAITYEWQKGPFDSDEEGFETISGATDSSFTIEGDNAQNSATYKCIVRDQYGNEATVTYKVTIDNNLYIYAGDDDYSYSARYDVTYGESKDLTTRVEADDKEGLTYQWYEGDHDYIGDAQTIDGETSASYHVDSVESKCYYFCKVTDKYGNTAFCEFDIYVQNHLTAYPYGESEDDSYAEYEVLPGNSITLRTMAKADDDSSLTYEWYNSYDERLDTDPEKPNEYTVEEVLRDTNVYCVVTDQYNNRARVDFTVVVDNKLVVTPVGYDYNNYYDEYIEVYVTPGTTKNLQVKASVTSGSLHYQWLDDDGDTIKEGDVDEKEAIKEATFDCTTRKVTGRTSYTCRVTDDYGHERTITFNIYVENHLDAYPEGAKGSDRITIYAKPNSKVTLHTVATADKGDLSYEWDYYGDNSYSLTAPDTITVDAENTDAYCYVSDLYGNSKEVCFSIKIENQLEAYPEGASLDQFGEHVNYVDLTRSANQSLNLKVNAKASAGTLKYYWEKREAYPTAWGENEYGYVELDQTGNTLSVKADKSTDYRCTVSDAYGNEKEVYFYTHVGTLSAHPEGAEIVDGVYGDRAVITTSGGSTTLRVITTAPANAQLTYKWTEGELNSSGWWPLEDGMNDSGKELVINAAKSKRYLCVVKDQFGNQALSYFNVNVDGMKLSSGNGTPTMTGDNEYELDVPVGYNEKITLKTVVEGNKEGLSYKWQAYEDWEFDTLPDTGDSLNVTGGQARMYRCRVSNASGNVAVITYNMRVKASFTAKPVGSTTNSTVIAAAEGESVTMKVAISGQLVDNWALFEWSDSNGRYLAGGNYEDSLTVSVQGKMTYTCTVTDQFGNQQEVYFHILSKQTTIDAMEVSLNTTTFTYDGKAKRPAATVKYKGAVLVSGKDYTIAYSNNINAGTARATITGVSMTGKVTREFKINKATPRITARIASAAIPVGSSTTVSLTGAAGAAAWRSADTTVASVSGTTVRGLKVGTVRINVTTAATGNYNAASSYVTVKVLPAATTKLTAANQAKGIKLTWAKVAGATGYVIYRNNAAVKTITNGATVTFTDTKANTNGAKYTYKVVARAATGTSTLSKSLVTYRVAKPAIKSLKNSASKKMTSKWAKNAKGSGYEIQYGLKKNFAGAKKVTATKNSVVTKTFKKLKKGKVYYVRMRTYKKVGKTKYYSAWSAVKKVKIAK